jgi:hypothetical protein
MNMKLKATQDRLTAGRLPNSMNSGRGRLVLLLAVAIANPACLYRPAPEGGGLK